MPTSFAGILIVVEGIDGAGKTTQVQLLYDQLTECGESVVRSKEPTDGTWGRKIRASASTGRMSLADELHAFIEDRKEHVANLILPSLNDGKIVILDRYYLSTVAYQGARGANVADLLTRMHEIAPKPDIVFLIDLDPQLALERIRESRGDIPNDFERLEPLREIRKIFLQLAAEDKTIHTIDGSDSIMHVREKVLRGLQTDVLNLKRPRLNLI
jgi:dTMP kinase